MGKSLSFRGRLFVFFLAVIVVTLALPSWYTRFAVSEDLLAESEGSVIRQLGFTASLLERQIELSGAPELSAWLRQAGEELGLRLTYIAADGTVLADSDVSFSDVPRMESHADRPEVVAALAGETGISRRFSGTLGIDFIYAARRVAPRGGLPEGVLRVSMPFADILSRKEQVIGDILIGVLLTLFLAVPLSYFFSRQLGRSINSMSAIAEAIGRGEYGRRIRVHPGKEFIPLAESINRMAENIQAQIQTIMAQKGQLTAILNGIKEGVMVLDGQGFIRAVNPALEEIFPGISASLGRRPIEVVRDSSLQLACDRILAPEEGEPEQFGLTIEPERGRVYDVGLVPLFGVEGLGAVVVFHDISRLKHLERVRRDFVANVSHELRTPLTSIKGYAETLITADKSNGEAVNRFLEIIRKNADHMTKIVGDLLSLSRLEAGKQDMEVSLVDAAQALASAYRACQPLADAKGIRLETRLPEGGVKVMADFDRLVQVLRNLVENAVRYSPEGSTVQAFHEDRENLAVIGVSDSGPGIPREELERIFERFYRVEKHRNRAPGSSGLGLAIARHIVERLGGEIWAESPARGGKTGATFFFSLPKHSRNENVTEVGDRG